MRHFICALSLQHANTTATIDWGWRRAGERYWINKLGEEVWYLSRAQNLNGVMNCVLYLGYRWDENSELHPNVLRDVARNRNITLINGDEFGRVR
jgi:hypothetical protein